MKLALIGAALCGVIALTGCASTSTLTPQAEADITDAYQVLCGPGAPATITGLVGVANASSSAIPAAGQSELNTANQICAAGVPTNEVVAGVDIFDILAEVEAVVPAAKVSAKARRLARYHRA